MSKAVRKQFEKLKDPVTIAFSELYNIACVCVYDPVGGLYKIFKMCLVTQCLRVGLLDYYGEHE